VLTEQRLKVLGTKHRYRIQDLFAKVDESTE